MGAATDGELYYRPLAMCSSAGGGISCDSDEPGAMVALRPATGERVWYTPHPMNGVRAKGGSIGGHGPAIVGGMLFMGSGYNVIHTSGNVLLAFGVE